MSAGIEVGDSRVGAAEHHVLTRAGDEVVLDEEWPGAVPPLDRL